MLPGSAAHVPAQIAHRPHVVTGVTRAWMDDLGWRHGRAADAPWGATGAGETPA
ncbi:MAG TPA: hypothetical protein VLK58_04800 [Conexibacter sp.]|nr:hypothetical protein [Conexibacter sp.]